MCLKLNKRQPPAKSKHRMMNLLFQGLSKEEILKELNRFCEHRDFYFISIEKKKVDPAQLKIVYGGSGN